MGFTIAGENQCQWCPKGGPQNCGLHRQSPINLERDRSVPGSPNEKECIDWHWMMYEEGACNWNDMKDQFTIERHALQLHIPQLSNGDIDCIKNGQRFYPRLDYSKGFPNWWWMQRVDVMVPSQHIQEGVQYAAEVTLAHFYEKAHAKNHVSLPTAGGTIEITGRSNSSTPCSLDISPSFFKTTLMSRRGHSWTNCCAPGGRSKRKPARPAGFLLHHRMVVANFSGVSSRRLNG